MRKEGQDDKSESAQHIPFIFAKAQGLKKFIRCKKKQFDF